ncbi:uncharacterized protein ARMOST_16573 [Armillaria ostoyae]|uniref:SAM domain-containing protein n=1 Tax=Armillaria ostoyae TaxID=47428 RepID=A0A284RWL9_ARMOS|nr:uncharacterized protein ARMOST_16573 [Armillaria ostoyae]
MAPRQPTPDEEPNEVDPAPAESHNASVSLRFIFYSKTSTGGKGKKKGATTEKKDPKVKDIQFRFATTHDNYVLFLNTMLEKFSITNRKATARSVYRIKMVVPPARKSEGIDIENFDEYEEAIAKIVKRKPTRTVLVIADVKDIEAALKKRQGGDDDDASSDSSEEEEEARLGARESKASAMDTELARIRKILEQEYRNDNGTGFTYINAESGASLSLTPAAMKEWARAIYDAQTDKMKPPNSATFDIFYRQSSIRPQANRERSVSSAQTERSSDNDRDTPTSNRSLDVISQALSLASTSRSTCCNHDTQAPLPSTPQRTASPIMNTPSKLTRFLTHCEKALGVSDALSYEDALRDQGFGPDILHQVEDKELRSIGFRSGDIIRLKQNAQRWWNGPDAKQKRMVTVETTESMSATPLNKKVRFEKRYHEGGRQTLFGPRMMETDDIDFDETDFSWFYFCKTTETYLPVPPGYVPIISDE